MGSQSDGANQIIAVPQGGGALQGIGEKFSPDLHTGTGNFTVPIAVPPGRNSFQPQLSLSYSTGNGNGPFGLGWSLSVPGVSRKTSKGVPQYDDSKDTFILSGSEDLVPVSGSPGETIYRPRTEGLFARITHFRDTNNDYWEARSKDGLVSMYGTPGRVSSDPHVIVDSAALADPEHSGHVFRWKLSVTTDPFGNRIEYAYIRDSQSVGPHVWDQLYLSEIRYADYGDPKSPQFLVKVRFTYDGPIWRPGQPVLPANQRLDSFSDYRAGFEIRTVKRCTQIDVLTEAGSEVLVRSYHLLYQDQLGSAPLNGASQLSQIFVEGRDGANSELLPPLEFAYTEFKPAQQKFIVLEGADLPPQSLADPSTDLVDILGQGLPDVLEMNGNVRFWRNRGNGTFDVPRPMRSAPAGVGLADPGVQILDANGDGRPDLLVTTQTLSGYYPLRFGGQWDSRSFQPYTKAPSFNLKDPEVHLVDLDGDGVTDAIRSGTSFECYFNNPLAGWNSSRRVARKQLSQFPDVNFADPRVKWADMTGDGLQDIVLVYDGVVQYWPNLGYGNWGERVTMVDSQSQPNSRPHFPWGYDPKRILLGDVDGDGAADLVYVDDMRVTLWLNQAGNRWSSPIVIEGTPPVSDTDSIRLADIQGNGVSGILWTSNLTAVGRAHMFFLDLTGGVKPYLLDQMNNHMGAVTTVTYKPSTWFYLQDEQKPETRWLTPLPFPVQVVARVETTDAFSGGKLTTEYTYHHGYWDGFEREFRGFGRVDHRDTDVFSTSVAVSPQYFSPPTETRTWFHQGAIGDSFEGWSESDSVPVLPGQKRFTDEYWQEPWPGISPSTQVLSRPKAMASFIASLKPSIRRDAFRSMRGKVLRTELYALDGTARQGAPYTVTEHVYGVREESPPAESDRLHIFFPIALSQRTTQWERGNDPLSGFTFTDNCSLSDGAILSADYDEYGQALSQISIAIPRGRAFQLPASPGSQYLSTLTVTTYAQRDDNQHYIVDRTSSTTTYELPNDGSLPLLELVRQIKAGSAAQNVVSQTVSFYDGAAYTGLPFGKIGDYGALSLTQTLVLTDSILQGAYGAKVPPYLSGNAPPNWTSDYANEFRTLLSPSAGYKYRSGGTWKATVPYTLDAQVVPTPPNGHCYKCVQAGVSGSTQPAFPTGAGQTVVDGSVVWQETGLVGYYRMTDQRKYDFPETWKATVPYILDAQVVPTPPNGHCYKCVQAGVSGSTQPAFPTGAGQTAVDGSVVWQETGFVRGLLTGKKDALGNETTVAYDTPYQLLPVSVTNAARLSTQANYDYRVLQINLVTDPNGNQTSYTFSPLGLLQQILVNGQPGQNLGDSPAAPGTQFTYTLMGTSASGLPISVADQRQPVSVTTVRRVHHASESDVPEPQRGETIQTVEFSDGFGRVLQTRTQGEDALFDSVSPGNPIFGDAGLPADQSQPGSNAVGQQAAASKPFVVVSGWQIYDNKGQVVEKYEPFFSTGWSYAQPSNAQLGQKATLYYDPRGHVIRTVNPDNSEQCVVYGVPGTIASPDFTNPDVFESTPWEAYTYDADDNAGRTHPTSSISYQQCWNTPSSVLIDALGRTVQAVERNRNLQADGSWSSSIVSYTTVSTYDIAGNLLTVTDPLGRRAFTYTYDLMKRALRAVSIDAGTRTSVPDAVGNIVEQRDSRGALLLHSYDALNRPIRLWARDASGQTVTLRERIIYGDDQPGSGLSTPQAVAANLLGKPYRHYDEAGLITFINYDFKGNLLDKTRNVITEAALLAPFTPLPSNWVITPFRMDWSSTDLSFLDTARAYETTTTYDALNRIKTMQYPQAVDGSRKLLVPQYNHASALESVQMDGSTYVDRIAYNAKGQRILISYGNGLMTRYAYDPETFRVLRMRTENYTPDPKTSTYDPSASTSPLQDFAYCYDLVGNILEITDRTSGSGILNNPEAAHEPDPVLAKLLVAGNAMIRDFAYDPIYRLVSATGRECDVPPPPPPWDDAPGCTDIKRTRFYTQNYQYDNVGNMTAWKHNYVDPSGNPGCNTRQFTLSNGTNHLAQLGISTTTNYQYAYDPGGNLILENTDRHFEWDESDRMRVFRVQPSSNQPVPPSIYAQYLYDSGGQRVMKLIRDQSGGFEKTIYIDGVFEHQRSVTASVTVENNSLHLMDNQKRIAIVRVGPALPGDAAPSVKYQFGDHLGSSNVVVDKTGAWVNREEYLPYGETCFGSFARKRYRFSGKERDEESGLYQYGARYYAPWLARWISCDRSGPRDSEQLYRFVGCNPLVMIDPSGYSSMLASGFLEGLGNRVVETLSSMAMTNALNVVTSYGYGSYQSISSLSEAYREGGGGGYGVLAAVNSVNPANSLLTQGWLAKYEKDQALELERVGDLKGAQAHARNSGAAFIESAMGAVELGVIAAGGVKLARRLKIPGTSQPLPKSTGLKSKGQILKEITKKHNDAADRLASELEKTGVKARHAGNETIKDASGKSIKGTAGTKTWRKPDVVAETDVGKKTTGIEIKTSDDPATVQKAADQLANEASFEGKGFMDNKPWTIGQGSGVAYVSEGGLLSVFKADISKN